MTGWAADDPLRALCRALDGGEVDLLRGHLDEASTLHFPGLSGLGGDYQGCEAITGLFHRLATATDGTLRFAVGLTTAPRAGALGVVGHLTATRDGRSVSTTVSVAATLACRIFGTISIEYADRSEWDLLWRQAGLTHGARSGVMG